MSSQSLGNGMAAFSFILWGLLPIYYQYLPNAATDELLAVRLIASVPLGALIVFAVTKRLPQFNAIWADKRSLITTAIAAVVMSISWVAFTWALTNERVMESSLGFFISPIATMALGVLCLGERLSLGKKVALALASIGLGYQVIHYGELPLVALSIAVFFSLYGWLKKKINYEWSTSLFVEALVLLPLAISYLLYKEMTLGTVSFHSGMSTLALYIGSAPATLLPLLFFSIAIRLTSLSSIGLMQYIEPSIQFILAVYLFGEAFDEVKLVSFSFIWAGLLFTVFDTLRYRHTAKSR